MSVNDHAYIIIGGSTKCATTSVFAYLADHPEISGSKIKESRFFWKGSYPLKKEGVNIDDGIESYESIFFDKPNSKYRIEATPDYLYSKESAHLINKNLNDVRMVFIVRNPIERVISWYKFAKQLNLITSDVTIDEFVSNQLNETSPKNVQHLLAVEQGLYGKYITDYINEFGKDRIKVVSYELLSMQPKLVLDEICAFLNIDSSYYSDYDFKILNQSVNVTNAESFNKYRKYRRIIRRGFKSILPGLLKNSFRKVFKGIDNVYMKSATTDFDDIVLSSTTKERLKDFYNDDFANVNSLFTK